MALQLTPEEARKARWGHTVLSLGLPADPNNPAADQVKLYARIGTLEHFGFTVEDPLQDLGAMGIDRIVTKKATRRSRWLGDVLKSGVRSHQTLTIWYPSVRGTALPGVPIVMEDLKERKKWQFQLDGQIGILVAALAAKALPFDIQVWGKTGNRYGAPILKAAHPFKGSTPAAQSSTTVSNQVP